MRYILLPVLSVFSNAGHNDFFSVCFVLTLSVMFFEGPIFLSVNCTSRVHICFIGHECFSLKSFFCCLVLQIFEQIMVYLMEIHDLCLTKGQTSSGSTSQAATCR
jgi:hypothetical protein